LAPASPLAPTMTSKSSARSADSTRASTRELPDGGPSGGWQPQEKISLADCIRAYTSGSAYAEFMEGKKGELKAGDSPTSSSSPRPNQNPPSQFHQNHRPMTIVGGRTVYANIKVATPRQVL